MDNINHLLEKSIEIYSEVATLYSGLLQKPLNTGSASKNSLNNSRVLSLLAEAQNVDTEIGVELLEVADRKQEPTSSLLERREQILVDLGSANRTLRHKANSVASLLKHEIGKMGQNRTAMAGYGSVQPARRSMLKSSY